VLEARQRRTPHRDRGQQRKPFYSLGVCSLRRHHGLGAFAQDKPDDKKWNVTEPWSHLRDRLHDERSHVDERRRES
jgi:hypothetical protein